MFMFFDFCHLVCPTPWSVLVNYGRPFFILKPRGLFLLGTLIYPRWDLLGMESTPGTSAMQQMLENFDILFRKKLFEASVIFSCWNHSTQIQKGSTTTRFQVSGGATSLDRLALIQATMMDHWITVLLITAALWWAQRDNSAGSDSSEEVSGI